MFVVIGKGGKIYWNSNSSPFRVSLRKAINEIYGVFVRNPVSDLTMLFGEEKQIDVSNVFDDLDGNDISVTLESVSNPEMVSVTFDNQVIKAVAGSVNDGDVTVKIRGSAGENYEFHEFRVSVYDPANNFTENFESGGFENINWQFSGDSDWIISPDVSYEGSFSAVSGIISRMQKSEIYVEMDYAVRGIISFHSKVSAGTNTDSLKFFINDDQISFKTGDSDWEYESYSLDPGKYVFKWSYQKGHGNSLKSEDRSWLDNVTFLGGIPTSIESNTIVSAPELYQNYPNPFNPETTISFSIPNDGTVLLSVYNYKGELIEKILDGDLQKGFHSFKFNGSDITSGVYFYTLRSAGITSMKKMLLIK